VPGNNSPRIRDADDRVLRECDACHLDFTGGGSLDATAIGSGVFAIARIRVRRCSCRAAVHHCTAVLGGSPPANSPTFSDSRAV
jgi:hypothetical protein